LGEMVDGSNQVTLQLWCPGVGGGFQEDRELMDAAECGATERARAVLSRGAKVDTMGNWGRTPLLWAAYNGHVEVAQVLVTAGANLNAKDSFVQRRPLPPHPSRSQLLVDL